MRTQGRRTNLSMRRCATRTSARGQRRSRCATRASSSSRCLRSRPGSTAASERWTWSCLHRFSRMRRRGLLAESSWCAASPRRTLHLHPGTRTPLSYQPPPSTPSIYQLRHMAPGLLEYDQIARGGVQILWRWARLHHGPRLQDGLERCGHPIPLAVSTRGGAPFSPIHVVPVH